jgi:DNA-directed RNA polymerase I, II, and III subunit RPABC1
MDAANIQLSESASRLFRVWKVVHSLLTKRGYATTEEDRNLTAEQFVERFGANPERKALTILVASADEGAETGGVGGEQPEQLIVYFPEDEKVGVKPIKNYTVQMKENNIKNAILVLRQGITPFAKQAVQVRAKGEEDDVAC